MHYIWRITALFLALQAVPALPTRGSASNSKLRQTSICIQGRLEENKVIWDPGSEPVHAVVSPRSPDWATGSKAATPDCFTLCSHGGQEAPCSQLASVCAEMMTRPKGKLRSHQVCLGHFFLAPALREFRGSFKSTMDIPCAGSFPSNNPVSCALTLKQLQSKTTCRQKQADHG